MLLESFYMVQSKEVLQELFQEVLMHFLEVGMFGMELKAVSKTASTMERHKQLL